MSAYRCNITYGVASTFGFDYLRDRLKIRREKGDVRPFWTAWGGTLAASGWSTVLPRAVA